MRQVFNGLFRASNILSRNNKASCSSFIPKATPFSVKNEKPVRVLVTGAAGQIGYSILPRIARGDAFGYQNYIELVLYDVPAAEKVMQGVKMELDDCAFSSLKSVTVHTDPLKAYSKVDFIVMLANAMVLKSGMPRSELLKENQRVYKETADILRSTAHKDLKILMIANPANTNSLLLIESLKGLIPAENITSLSRLDHNRARQMLAQKLGVGPFDIRKIIIWGNHSSTQVPDIRFAEYYKKGQGWQKVSSVLKDEEWVKNVFIPAVRDRVHAIIEARGKSSSLSAASAGIDHIRNWMGNKLRSDWVSMGIYSESYYENIPRGIVFSHPCICENGDIQVVKNLQMDEFTQSMIEKSVKELVEERASILS